MTVLNITADDLKLARQLLARGDLAGVSAAWAMLGEKGDAYGFLASKVVASDTAGMHWLARVFYELVHIQWTNTAGAGLWGDTTFLRVGQQHLDNYLQLLENSNLTGVGGYTLPTTIQIEDSYKKALLANGVPPITAIDSLFSVLDTAAGDGGCFAQWRLQLGADHGLGQLGDGWSALGSRPHRLQLRSLHRHSHPA